MCYINNRQSTPIAKIHTVTNTISTTVVWRLVSVTAVKTLLGRAETTRTQRVLFIRSTNTMKVIFNAVNAVTARIKFPRGVCRRWRELPGCVTRDQLTGSGWGGVYSWSHPTASSPRELQLVAPDQTRKFRSCRRIRDNVYMTQLM